jgi:hypothetical protein
MDPVILAAGVAIVIAVWYKETQAPEPPENVDGLAVEDS